MEANYGIDLKTIICICPLCGKKHKRRMDWTGNGIPKVYCIKCFDIVKNSNIEN